MEFLPKPKRLSRDTGSFFLCHSTELVLQNTASTALLYAEMLQKTVQAETGFAPAVRRGAARPGDIVLRVDSALTADHYTIAVTQQGITLAAGNEETLCNGVQTLRQFVQRYGALLPAVSVEDWPDLPVRGYYLDCSRGRVPTLATLKRYADLLCRYKVNQWQLYIEHTYLFRNLSEAWRDDTPLTAEEIMDLDRYCEARHIELVPSLSTFGHMYKILSTKSYCDLCELKNSEKIPFSYTYAGEHHTLNVSNEGALPFIISLIDEYRALFTSKKFNICADETFDLGKGRSKPLADVEGDRTLYVRHVKALCEYLVSQGCIPMFWGDIMWRFPEACAELPKETICLNWGYLPDQRENEIRDIAQSGIMQYACPGVCGWNQWMPLMKNAYSNNRAMCAHAKKYAAGGLLNTDWGDYAHINDPRLLVPGILYGAAFGWNAETVPFEEINAAISFLEYGDRSETLLAAMAEMACHEKFDWRHAVNWIEAADEAARAAVFADVDRTAAPQDNLAVRVALQKALAASGSMQYGKKEIMPLLSLTAESICLWNDIGLWIAAGDAGRPEPDAEGAALAVRLENWLHLYQQSWRQVSKESGLPRLTELVCRYADTLRGRIIKEPAKKRGSDR